jgi:hypothetical protein
MPEIKVQDKERLDKLNEDLYDANDYPSDVTKLVSVDYGFDPIGVDADWEKLCPEIYARERTAARNKFAKVVENAAVEFADRFVKYVKQVVDQLGNRTRLNPAKGHERLMLIDPNEKPVLTNIEGAEVVTMLTHKHDEDIPVGHVRCELRLVKAGKGKSPMAWMSGTMKEQDFHLHLRPYTTEERKKLFDSTIANLKGELETFINIGNLLGPYQGVISQSVSDVKDLLTQASSSMVVSEISEQLRAGSFFRNQMKSTLVGVAQQIEKTMVTAGEKRRSISKSMQAKFADEEDED